MVPGDLDGRNLLPVLRNRGQGEVRSSTEELVFHFVRTGPLPPGSRSGSSLYRGDFKLLKFYDTEELHLFDIAEDPEEQNDLADRMPARVEDMHSRLTNYLDALNVPTPDPSSELPEGSQGFGMGMGFGMAAGFGAMGMGGPPTQDDL